ncbi:IS200/IS605 family transposase [Catenibacterium mitsuokai]|uniref:IS200/IS605 family transposase n=1 Tax=Catenibacterium mitsuokai TaxID=100886 RepID=UPI00193105D0
MILCAEAFRKNIGLKSRVLGEEKYHSALHCKYLTQYHIIWCPEFRFLVLKGNVDNSLKQILQKICNDYNYHIKSLEVMPDHIHIFIDVPQTVAPYAMWLELLKASVLSNYLKRISSLKSSMQDVELYGQEGICLNCRTHKRSCSS